MQTLFIPDKIQIDFFDSENNPLRQEKILIGIRTFANRKNNIDLSPFLTDNEGKVIITTQDINDCYQNYISYGIMDYSSLESAKPEIEIYFWGNDRLNRLINYWTKILDEKTDLKQLEMWGDKLGKKERESAEIERKERKRLELFKTCHNRDTKYTEDIILIKDTWDKVNNELNYRIKI